MSDAIGPLRDVLRTLPEARIEDAYKWLFQATQGGEHAAPDEAQARRWLEREWIDLDESDASHGLVEPLRRDDAIVRLHLRPYKARGGLPDALLRAFLDSAAAWTADASAFTVAWLALGDALRDATYRHVTRADWERLDAATKPRGYPAVHHSEAYRLARRPAYRVLTGAAAARLGKGLT